MMRFLFRRRFNQFDVTALIITGALLDLQLYGWAAGVLFGGVLISVWGENSLDRS